MSSSLHVATSNASSVIQRGLASPVAVEVHTIVFPTIPAKLAPSKAAGIEGIRLSSVGGDLHLEELGTSGKTIIGFILHPVTDKANKLTAVAVTQMGPAGSPSPLSTAQRAALTMMVNELKEYKASRGAGPKRRDVDVGDVLRGMGEAVDTGIACGLAGAELGVNVLADAGCVVSFGLFSTTISDMTKTEDPIVPPNPDPPTDPEPLSTSFSNTSQDSNESGDGSGSGSDGNLNKGSDLPEKAD